MAGVKGMTWAETPKVLERRELGRLRSKAMHRWRGMMKRCYKLNDPKYHRYGGRGIKVCDRWHDFELYYTDTGDSPARGLSLDRPDNNGDYTPDNWRWATIIEQLENREPFKHPGRNGARNTKPRPDQSMRVFDGEKELRLADAATELGVKYNTLLKRLRRWRGDKPTMTAQLAELR